MAVSNGCRFSFEGGDAYGFAHIIRIQAKIKIDAMSNLTIMTRASCVRVAHDNSK
jgi:hypothetical protein